MERRERGEGGFQHFKKWCQSNKELLDYNTIQILFFVKNTTHLFAYVSLPVNFCFLFSTAIQTLKWRVAAGVFYFNFLFIGFHLIFSSCG